MTNPLPTASRTRKGLYFVLVALGLGLGLVAGLVIQAAVINPEPPASSSEHPATLPGDVHVLDQARTDLQAIDDLIRAECFDAALARCQLARTAKATPEVELSYREALCLEGLRRWKEAARAYVRAVGPGGDAPALAWSALGQARCAIHQGEPDVAHEFLNRVVLSCGRGDHPSRAILEECLYLRARLALMRLDPNCEPDPFNPETLAWPVIEVNPAHALERFTPAPSVAVPTAHKPGLGAVVVEYHAASPEEPLVTAYLPEHSIREQLKFLAGAAELSLRLGEGVDVFLTNQLAVHVEDVSLAEVLTALLGSTGATWHLEPGVLTIERTLPATPLELRGRVADSLRRAIAAAPEHSAARAARANLANLEFLAGRYREAAREYRRLLESDLNSSVNLYAAYNLGLLELRQGNRAGTRKRFLEVLDRAPGTHWADLANWWMGRTWLDAGDTASARKAFQAVVNSRVRELAGAAVLGLSTCHFLEGDDASAGKLLENQRANLGETHAALAIFFQSWLRYRTRPSETRWVSLVDALRNCGEGRPLNLAGVLLAGEAYCELGLDDHMTALYEQVLEAAHGPLAIRMSFRVAERYNQIDLRHQARQQYLVVAALDPGELGARAELRVAELATREGRGEECVRRCRGLIGRTGIDRSELLSVLGRGYELTGNYRLAAECFAGRMPNE